MSRFDNELTKTADNAWQQRNLPGSTTPRQEGYNQSEQPFGDALVPAQVNVKEEAGDWIANMPMMRQVDAQDLDAAMKGEIVGGPGSSAVYAEGGPMYASTNLDDTLYNIYRASREIRDAIDTAQDFDFENLVTAAINANSFVRKASADQDLVYSIGSIAGIVNDIENSLVVTANYQQAYRDLMDLEGLTESINKIASGEADDEDEDDSEGTTASKKVSGEHCTGPGCEKLNCDGKMSNGNIHKGSNGNQESLQIVDVRDLDDAAGVFDKQKVMTPDHMTNVQEAEEVNGEDAGYVNYYNDGAETGKVPQDGDDLSPWPYDGTNPALVPYQKAASAAREKIFESLQIVERLEKLGMVQRDDRAKHIAKFEQMSDAKLAGFKTALDAFEESGARQPRSQKVASGSNRMPEMGRLTTASTISRQDIASDDWLMTL